MQNATGLSWDLTKINQPRKETIRRKKNHKWIIELQKSEQLDSEKKPPVNALTFITLLISTVHTDIVAALKLLQFIAMIVLTLKPDIPGEASKVAPQQ